MIKAIQSCPHQRYSGLDVTRSPCRVLEDLNEDLYFAIVLRGIDAPLPSAWKASLFALESLWAEQVLEQYGKDFRNEIYSSRPLMVVDDRIYTIPMGVHKAFWYLPNELIRSDLFRAQCPFFPYTFDPSMSRWEPDVSE